MENSKSLFLDLKGKDPIRMVVTKPKNPFHMQSYGRGGRALIEPPIILDYPTTIRYDDDFYLSPERRILKSIENEQWLESNRFAEEMANIED